MCVCVVGIIGVNLLRPGTLRALGRLPGVCRPGGAVFAFRRAPGLRRSDGGVSAVRSGVCAPSGARRFLLTCGVE